MFGMEKLFPGFNKEAKDDTREASKNTGLQAENIVHDTSERQEHFTNPEGREEKMRIGVGQILDEFPISPDQALVEQKFISEKLLEKGLVTTEDQALSGYPDILHDAIESVAKERIAAREKKIKDRRID